jgi:4-diphosphocytidyl-2-C-methyl-D-erythritol kinase
MQLKLRSPAKINLDFKIVGKRSDGMHLIESNMQTVGLFDFLEIIPGDTNQLVCDPKYQLSFENSIFSKTFDVFRQHAPDVCCVEIRLHKNIPIGSGLGGGSSNAATFLWGLNLLVGNRFSAEALMQMSKSIGSDVPFFFTSGRAFATGTGVDLIDMPEAFESQNYTLIFADMPLLTKDVFGLVNLNQIDKRAKNHLEQFACRCSKPYEEHHKKVIGCFSDAFMTGSGSTMVVINRDLFVQTHFHVYDTQGILKELNCWY